MSQSLDFDAVYADRFFDVLARGGSEAQAEAAAKAAIENLERAIRNRALAARRRARAA